MDNSPVGRIVDEAGKMPVFKGGHDKGGNVLVSLTWGTVWRHGPSARGKTLSGAGMIKHFEINRK